MKITRKEIFEESLIPPFYYGLAYWTYDIAIFYPIPINYIVKFGRWIRIRWDMFRSRPSEYDMKMKDLRFAIYKIEILEKKMERIIENHNRVLERFSNEKEKQNDTK